MARVAYAAQIDVRFGDPVSDVLDIGIGVCRGNFARESLHLTLIGPSSEHMTSTRRPFWPKSTARSI
jgi:hypothetical protein